MGIKADAINLIPRDIVVMQFNFIQQWALYYSGLVLFE